MLNPFEIKNMAEKQKEKVRRNVIFVLCVIVLCLMVKCGYSQTIEDLAAKKFCSLLNRHRIRQGMLPVQMNDTLCKVAKNHNIWMSKSNLPITHVEEPNTPYFTGENPSDRGKVMGIKYGLSEVITKYYPQSGKTKDEISDIMAKEAFDIWNMSDKGHHQIIFGKQDLQGISFYNGYVTAVFMRKSYY